jgi:hypothetical protein
VRRHGHYTATSDPILGKVPDWRVKGGLCAENPLLKARASFLKVQFARDAPEM